MNLKLHTNKYLQIKSTRPNVNPRLYILRLLHQLLCHILRIIHISKNGHCSMLTLERFSHFLSLQPKNRSTISRFLGV